MTGPSHRSRRIPRRAAVLLVGGLLAGCGQDAGVREAVSTESAAAPAAATTPAPGDPAASPDLAAGLLPADAFGPGAQLVPLSDRLPTGAPPPVGGGQIGPPECAATLAALHARAGQVADVAAQAALEGTRVTGEALVRGGAAEDAVAAVSAAVEDCRQATVTAAEHGEATIGVEELSLPPLGDAALGLSVTASATLSDGRQVTVPALVGLVEDGDRLVVLATADRQGGELDPAAFTALLERAVEVQAAALD